MIAAPQFRSGRGIAGKDALDETQIVFVTRRRFDWRSRFWADLVFAKKTMATL